MTHTRTLPAAVVAHAMYTASHDVTPLAQPTRIALADYREYVYTEFMRGENFSASVLASYAAMSRELRKQWAMLIEIVDVEFCDEDPTPLTASGAPSYRAFVNEVESTGKLRVYRSTGKHPILDNRADGVLHNNRMETMNSIFRAVHDFFGHLASGGHFGWAGETAAYYSHAAMFSVDARLALFNETVAQQCYYAIVKDFLPEDRAVAFLPAVFSPPMA